MSFHSLWSQVLNSKTLKLIWTTVYGPRQKIIGTTVYGSRQKLIRTTVYGPRQKLIRTTAYGPRIGLLFQLYRISYSVMT